MERKQNSKRTLKTHSSLNSSIIVTPEVLHTYSDNLGYGNYRFQFGPCIVEVMGSYQKAGEMAVKAATSLGFSEIELLSR